VQCPALQASSLVDGQHGTIECDPSLVDGQQGTIECHPSLVDGQHGTIECHPSLVDGQHGTIECHPTHNLLRVRVLEVSAFTNTVYPCTSLHSTSKWTILGRTELIFWYLPAHHCTRLLEHPKRRVRVRVRVRGRGMGRGRGRGRGRGKVRVRVRVRVSLHTTAQAYLTGTSQTEPRRSRQTRPGSLHPSNGWLAFSPLAAHLMLWAILMHGIALNPNPTEGVVLMHGIRRDTSGPY
jgi:hypothetical protein